MKKTMILLALGCSTFCAMAQDNANGKVKMAPANQAAPKMTPSKNNMTKVNNAKVTGTKQATITKPATTK